MLLGAMLPAVDFDVLEYHLQGPKEYFQAGRIAFLPHNVYTNMPFGVEMLHLLGMEVLGDWWWGGLVGQLLVALYAPAAAVLIAAAAGLAGTRRAAWLAAIIYLSTPWIYRLAVIAYVEGPLCFYHAALIWAAVRVWNDRHLARGSWWTLLGLLAGGAMACKYPALISAVIPFGLLALADSWRSRSARPVLAYVLGWSIVMAPWLARTWSIMATRSIRWAIRSSAERTGTRLARPSGCTPTAPRRPLSSRSGARWWTSPADRTGNRRSTSPSRPWRCCVPRLAEVRRWPWVDTRPISS